MVESHLGITLCWHNLKWDLPTEGTTGTQSHKIRPDEGQKISSECEALQRSFKSFMLIQDDALLKPSL